MSQSHRGAVVDSPEKVDDETAENPRATAAGEQATPSSVGDSPGARVSHACQDRYSSFQRRS